MSGRALGLVALLAALLGAPARAGSRWLVRFDARSPRRVEVAAELEVREGLLRMHAGIQAAHLERGWAEYVEELAARDAAGAPLALEPLAGARWRLARPAERATIRYAVRLEHDRARWPFGINEASFVRNELVFAVTQALLVLGDGAGPFEVRIDVPEGWRVASPWPAGADGVRRVDDEEDLVRSLLAVGPFAEARVESGGLAVLVASEERLAEGLERLAGLVGALAPRYAALLGPLPETRYVVVVGRRSGALRGGAFRGGLSLLVGDLDARGRERWGPLLGHELLHEWIGARALAFASAREEWLKEGATEYLAWLELARAGLVSRERWLGWLDEQIELYLEVAGQGAPSAAGLEKAASRGLVYGGGVLACLALDLSARERGSSLAEILRALREEQQAGGGPLDAERVRAAVSEEDAAFLRRHVEGPEPMPVEALLARAGLERAGFLGKSVRVDEDALPEARARLEVLLGPQR
jgi:predicted metalloprotease with PDZ domain